MICSLPGCKNECDGKHCRDLHMRLHRSIKNRERQEQEAISGPTRIHAVCAYCGKDLPGTKLDKSSIDQAKHWTKEALASAKKGAVRFCPATNHQKLFNAQKITKDKLKNGVKPQEPRVKPKSVAQLHQHFNGLY